MLFPHKLKIKAIYYHIDRCDDIKELSTIYKKLKKIRNNKYIARKVIRKRNISQINHIKKKSQLNTKKNNFFINTIKKEIKLEINTLLRSTIAHEMDPTQRAGQTVASNIKSAKKFGRGNKARKKPLRKSSILLKLLNFLLSFILPTPTSLLNSSIVIQNAIISNLKKRNNDKESNVFSTSITKVISEPYKFIENNKKMCIGLMRL